MRGRGHEFFKRTRDDGRGHTRFETENSTDNIHATTATHVDVERAHTHSHSQIVTHTQSCTHAVTHTHSHTHTHTHTLTVTHTYATTLTHLHHRHRVERHALVQAHRQIAWTTSPRRKCGVDTSRAPEAALVGGGG